ncbi:MAG: cyclic-di-AMP receptor, partial [Bacillota bacterium]|nr:cyclic-di-AMP receptor [Bacillota bacterium]
SGGFLRAGNTTLLIGIEADRLDDLMHVIESSCKTRKETVTTPPMLGEGSMISMPIEISVGGATIFISDVEKYIKL